MDLNLFDLYEESFASKYCVFNFDGSIQHQSMLCEVTTLP